MKKNSSSSDQIVQVGREPNRVDVITSIDGVTWEEAWESKVPIELDGCKCWVIGKARLIQKKKATGRLQDTVDVQNLESGAGSSFSLNK
jgi:hypothetical protein